MKLKTSEQIKLLDVSTLSVKYRGKLTGKIIGVAEATFPNAVKPKLLLEVGDSSERIDFVLNATNQHLFGERLVEKGLERDTDAIPNGTTVELEVYETGSTGRFEYGIKITKITFPK